MAENSINLPKEDFYQASSDWAYHIYYAQTLWLRRALIGIVLLALLLGASLVANLCLLPLKEKVPYLYAFDHATGEITKIGELETTPLTANWALTKYFLINYVINREGYDYYHLDIPYQKIFAQSSDDVRKQYESQVKSDNNNSPLRIYSKDKYVTVRVISVNRLNDNTVDVKFEKRLHDRTTQTEKILQKEAIIKWEFAKAKTSLKELERDPLGFKVTYYQVSQVNIE